MTATERLQGVVAVRLSALDGLLVIRYDPALTTADAVNERVNAIIDEVEQ